MNVRCKIQRNSLNTKGEGSIMKIKNIGKFIRSILLMLGAAAALLLIFAYPPALSHTDLSYKTISVSSGDTLWGIAQTLQGTDDYYKGKDVRYIVDDLVNVNHLSSKALYINQELQVPEM